jgi:DNA polymerase III sliding clamp (beta) subunit (PCNA family)
MKLELSQTSLSEIMKVCSNFVKENYAKPILGFIQLKCESGVCTATAIEGSRARIIAVKCPDHTDSDDGVYYLPPLKLPKASYRGTAVIESDGTKQTLTMGNFVFTHDVPKGEFPDTARLTQSEPDYECVFVVGNLLDALKSFDRKDRIVFISRGNTKPHVLKRIGVDENYALVIPNRKD